MQTNGAVFLITEKTTLITRYYFNAGDVFNILHVIVRYYLFYYEFRKKFHNDILYPKNEGPLDTIAFFYYQIAKVRENTIEDATVPV